ncbi:MAG: hypothetical protein H6626_00455 [Pseudobdellovibrionaceae bacterium]|nr:hypothetical protein [Bdellovibrionales bacterium]USN47596.1 MAG: hypothetical protein H6626_00455 [Pseudobdellovibrionaceae bacterium]
MINSYDLIDQTKKSRGSVLTVVLFVMFLLSLTMVGLSAHVNYLTHSAFVADLKLERSNLQHQLSFALTDVARCNGSVRDIIVPATDADSAVVELPNPLSPDMIQEGDSFGRLSLGAASLKRGKLLFEDPAKEIREISIFLPVRNQVGRAISLRPLEIEQIVEIDKMTNKMTKCLSYSSAVSYCAAINKDFDPSAATACVDATSEPTPLPPATPPQGLDPGKVYAYCQLRNYMANVSMDFIAEKTPGGGLVRYYASGFVGGSACESGWITSPGAAQPACYTHDAANAYILPQGDGIKGEVHVNSLIMNCTGKYQSDRFIGENEIRELSRHSIIDRNYRDGPIQWMSRNLIEGESCEIFGNGTSSQWDLYTGGTVEDDHNNCIANCNDYAAAHSLTSFKCFASGVLVREI